MPRKVVAFVDSEGAQYKIHTMGGLEAHGFIPQIIKTQALENDAERTAALFAIPGLLEAMARNTKLVQGKDEPVLWHVFDEYFSANFEAMAEWFKGALHANFPSRNRKTEAPDSTGKPNETIGHT